MNYYELLGVSSDASEDQIRQAYRSKVRRFHPDVNHAPNAGQLTALLNEAWGTLGDSRARARYDRSIGVFAPTEWNTPSSFWPTPGAYTPRWTAHDQTYASSEETYYSEPDHFEPYDAEAYGSHPEGYQRYYSTLAQDGRGFSFGRAAVGVGGALVMLAFLSSVFHWFPLVATAFLTIVFFRAFGRFWH